MKGGRERYLPGAKHLPTFSTKRLLAPRSSKQARAIREAAETLQRLNNLLDCASGLHVAALSDNRVAQSAELSVACQSRGASGGC